MTQGLWNSRLGILEFSASLRGSKATKARNSRLGILEFLDFLGEF